MMGRAKKKITVRQNETNKFFRKVMWNEASWEVRIN
jgi:hypothetical protein